MSYPRVDLPTQLSADPAIYEGEYLRKGKHFCVTFPTRIKATTLLHSDISLFPVRQCIGSVGQPAGRSLRFAAPEVIFLQPDACIHAAVFDTQANARSLSTSATRFLRAVMAYPAYMLACERTEPSSWIPGMSTGIIAVYYASLSSFHPSFFLSYLSHCAIIGHSMKQPSIPPAR